MSKPPRASRIENATERAGQQEGGAGGSDYTNQPQMNLRIQVAAGRRNCRNTLTTTSGNITRSTTVTPTVNHSRRG